MSPRAYHQTKRAEQSAETRRRILDAMQDRLRSGTAGEITVDGVAKQTGVARSTVYLIFGSRDGLMEALALDVAERAGIGAVVEAEAEPDPRRTLRRGIRAGAHMYAADRELFSALNALSRLRPGALGRVDAMLDTNRAAGMRTLVARLAEHGMLRPDVTPQEAEDMLWLVTGFDAFDLLHTGRGLDVDAAADRLVALGERSVCVPE